MSDLSSLAAAYAAELSWAATPDRAARTAPARSAAEQRFLDLADGDPVRAAHLRKAHFKAMALKSVQARQRRAAARKLLEASALETVTEQMAKAG